MTYLVLARKWRPRSFDTLIGQDHVVRALTNALSTQRLHHAWLFTGTRGVGKTTLSRILAKSLNCEQGITPTPCGVCRACTEIDAGRFVDYIELDAASNRGVDEMTQLLEQAVYAPSSGRFKVYMIDEVHMLTGHAFNAMLKTLEEPPPHVKFILATTDPQKIPVTVLSRCLQFNLKLMTADAIVAHLRMVLGEEGIEFEMPALRLIAKAAAGSMRDALSLTDQAIAYSAGKLTQDAIQGMLGTIDQRYLLRLLQALSAGSAAEVLAVADELATRGLSYSGALADLAVLLSRVAIEQRIPGSVPVDDPLAEDIAALGKLLPPDFVQLFYSVAVHSRGELSLAPDEYAGFVMACLRMLALVPTSGSTPAVPGPGGGHAVAAEVPSQRASASTSPAPAVQQAAGARAGVSSSSAHSAGAADASPARPGVTVAPAQPAQSSPPAPSLSQQSQSRRSQPRESQPLQSPPPQSQVQQSQAQQSQAQQSQAQQSQPPRSQPRKLQPAPSAAMPAEPAWEGQSGGAAADSDGRHADELPYEVVTGVSDDVPAWEDIPVDETAGRFEPYDERRQPAATTGEADDEAFESMAPVPDDVALPEFEPAKKKIRSPRLRDMTSAAWPALAAQLPLTGLVAELARQSEWLGVSNDEINLRVAVRTLAESPGQSRLCTLLSEHFGVAVQLNIEYGATGDETAYAVEQAEKARRQQKAEQAVQLDPFVQSLVNDFGAVVVPGSVRPAIVDKAA
ncbi:MAG: DNA polymerase III subunit gamma/tau [Burkholderiaceae bacterium]|nr:MAG: DNA polymerase III subunit gamma/tau [Burkholderiaceae bacterium]TAM01236.1 MAG: DNA polymerase III subunit gamma/tau [Pusillimonas sp.]